MRKRIKSLFAVGLAIAVFAPSAFANLTATLYTQADGQPNGLRDPKSYGGEFSAVLSGNSSLSSYVLAHYASGAQTTVNGHSAFETFCVEMTQQFTPGTAYNAAIGSTIVPGNAPLAQGVAWLYMEFASGGLATYATTHFGSAYQNEDYSFTAGSSRELCADELQDAIWYLQGEMNSGNSSYWNNKNFLYSFDSKNPTADPFVNLVKQVFGSVSVAEESTTAKGASDFGVMVLNLSSTSKGTTVYDQDQLIYCPVPEPATIGAGLMLLLPLGWGAIRGLRHRKPGT